MSNFDNKKEQKKALSFDETKVVSFDKKKILAFRPQEMLSFDNSIVSLLNSGCNSSLPQLTSVIAPSTYCSLNHISPAAKPLESMGTSYDMPT
jgi:hypothetical protein